MNTTTSRIPVYALALALPILSASIACAATVDPPAHATRDPAYWPFSVECPWNTPLGSGAV